MIPVRQPFAIGLVCQLLLSACSGQSGGESPGAAGPDFSASCAVQSSRDLAMSQQSPIGFSGQDMLDLAAGDTTVSLRYRDGSETSLMLSIERDAEVARYIERINEAAGTSIDCSSQLRVNVLVSFATADGEFAESFSSELVASQQTRTGIFVNLDADSLTGSFDFARFDRRQYAERRLLIDALFDSSGPGGRLQIRGRPSDGGAPTDTDVGHWPPSGD